MSDARVRVVYWNNIPSPYVAGRFNALARRDNLDFEAWFDRRREPDRSWDVCEDEWAFRSRYLARDEAQTDYAHAPIEALHEVRPQLLVSLYAQRQWALGSLAAKSMGARTAFRVLPTFDAWVRRRGDKEVAKRLLFRTVDGVKVPGPAGVEVARRYGVPRDRIVPVTQSVDVAHYATPQPGTALDAARCIRAEMGGNCQFICVGRLWEGKGLDFLFEAFRQVVGQHPGAALLIIGDGVDEARYRALAEGIPNVRFAGFVQPVDLPAYYALADALVFPTLGDPYGLVVEEAMAAGLPVISTEAAGDIRLRLPEGEAGLVVPPAQAVPLAEAMLALARDPGRRREMGRHGCELVQMRTHYHWAHDFEVFVDRILSKPPRRGAVALAGKALGALARTSPLGTRAPEGAGG